MGQPFSLRWKVLSVLLSVTLVPAVLLGALGYTSVRSLSGVARDLAQAAVTQEIRQQLLNHVQEKARADDAIFEGVRAEAVTLSRYIAWYYNHPENLPEPGFLRGGSVLEQMPGGHWANAPDTNVGVFISRHAVMTDGLWREVGLLSFADPLLVSIRESTPGAARAWVISASRITRIHRNIGLGHVLSGPGPDYDPSEDEPFQAASPDRNPDRLPVWSSPYIDPMTGQLMISAVAPVYSDDGQFRAVAGVDLTLLSVEGSVLQEQPAPVQYGFLLDREGRVVSASEKAWADLGLGRPLQGQPGRAAAPTLNSSELVGVRDLAAYLRGASSPGLVPFEAANGSRYAAFAPLPTTGWVIVLVAPVEAVSGAGAAVESAIARSERLYLIGTAAGMLLVILLVAMLSTWAAGGLTRPVARLLEGTRKLARDLSFRMDDMGRDELGQLASAFNAMAASIERSRDEAVRHAKMVVEERGRLAREIHDTIAQGLAGVVIQLETAEDAMGEPERALPHLRRARDLAREGLQEARRSVWNMRPAALAEGGMARAVRSLAQTLEQDGIPCQIEVEEGLMLPEVTEDTLFRVCQEALANVRNHSRARRAAVRLWSQGPDVALQVWDDGQGFDPAQVRNPGPAGGFGLWAMRERLARIGGRLTVESSPGAGTTVTASVPREGGAVNGAGGQGTGG